MRLKRGSARLALATAGVFIGGLAGAAPSMAGELVYGLTESDRLAVFDSDRPGTVTPVALTGLAAGDDVVAVDFRPATTQLFALIKNGGNAQVAQVDFFTGAVTKRGAPFALGGSSYGFDFNPTVDRIRIHSDADDNLRVNPNNGAVAATDPPLAYDSPPADPTVTATAYTSSFPGSDRTALFGIDTAEDRVVAMRSPAPTFQTVSRGAPLGFDATAASGFDVAPTGQQLAVLRTGTAAPKLYRLDVDAGANPARDIGTIADANPDATLTEYVEDVAIRPPLSTFATLLSGTPQRLARVSSDAPNDPFSAVDIAGLPSGVTLVGIDNRNENGTVHGVGSDSRLYRLNLFTRSGHGRLSDAVLAQPVGHSVRSGLQPGGGPPSGGLQHRPEPPAEPGHGAVGGHRRWRGRPAQPGGPERRGLGLHQPEGRRPGHPAVRDRHHRGGQAGGAEPSERRHAHRRGRRAGGRVREQQHRLRHRARLQPGLRVDQPRRCRRRRPLLDRLGQGPEPGHGGQGR